MVCTAPVPGTVDDFWQMIWDQRINIVVMLSRMMEGSKVCGHTHLHTLIYLHTYPQLYRATTSLICSASVKTTTQNLQVTFSAGAGFR